MDKYFVIINSEGETTVSCMSKERLLNELVEDGSGYDANEIMSKLDEENTSYWRGKFLIVKGEIVTPIPVIRISEWDIE